MIFTKEMLTNFVYMPPKDWRALTVSMGVMYRVRLYKETHIVDSVRDIFGTDIPPQAEWNEVKKKVNKVRRQVTLAKQREDEEAGVTTNDSPRAKKRVYQRAYMRRRRAKLKGASADT
jgi:hypothetical protein